jgi:hypothetical protein
MTTAKRPKDTTAIAMGPSRVPIDIPKVDNTGAKSDNALPAIEAVAPATSRP